MGSRLTTKQWSQIYKQFQLMTCKKPMDYPILQPFHLCRIGGHGTLAFDTRDNKDVTYIYGANQTQFPRAFEAAASERPGLYPQAPKFPTQGPLGSPDKRPLPPPETLRLATDMWMLLCILFRDHAGWQLSVPLYLILHQT